jgi:hypothetical protein
MVRRINMHMSLNGEEHMYISIRLDALMSVLDVSICQ